MKPESKLQRPSCFFRKIISFFVFIVFLFHMLMPGGYSYSMEAYSGALNLPAPGTMVGCSERYKPALIKGMTVHPENPLLFDFVVEPGDSLLGGSALNEQAIRMVKYFLASVTVPDEQMWVNLSPNEPDRIIPDGLGATVLGQDLLAQDYILKQLTSTLMYPDSKVGKAFWDRIYVKAYEQFGTTDIPVDSYNKVWVVPSRAAVYEEGNSVFIVSRVLKVMLEEDYVSMRKWQSVRDSQFSEFSSNNSAEVTNASGNLDSRILKEIIIPELEKEVNEGRHFANLRQIYNAMILAKWYKENLKETLLGQVYADRNKVRGVDNSDPGIREKIYAQYMAAFKKGVYDMIREEYDPVEKTVVPRKYFSGGLWGLHDIEIERYTDRKDLDSAMATDLTDERDRPLSVRVSLLEVGPEANQTEVQSVEDYAIFAKPFSSLTRFINEPEVKDLLDRFEGADYTMIDAGEEYMAPGLGPAAEYIASGGLGFLSGEFNAAGNEMHRTALASISLAYKTRKDTGSGVFQQIDYENMPNVFPVTVQMKEGGEVVPFQFPVDFKGNYYNEAGLGRKYDARSYMVDNDGNPLLLLSVPEDPNMYHHLYDDFNDNEKRWIQYGLNARLLVEMIKNSGSAPDIIRLNEGHMAFVYPAIRNDIEYQRSIGKKSIFEGVKIIYTNHTPEFAGIPTTGDIPRLKKLVGEDLVPDYMLTQGHFHSLEAMAQNALNQDPRETGIELVINGVSREHYEVILKLLLERFPDAERIVTYVQNASRAKDWFSPRLAQAIEEHGAHNITGEMLLEIAEQNKADINKSFRNIYAKDADLFYARLQEVMPDLAFMKRWKKYQNSEPFLALVKWILGDRNKIYTHPAIQDLSSLQNPENMESVFLNPQWVDSPGLDLFVAQAEEQKGALAQDPAAFIETIDQELLEKVPALSFVNNWTQYKDSKAFVALVQWLLGDVGKTYAHPEIHDISILQSRDKLEAIFIQPKWVEGPGLNMLGKEAQKNKTLFSENKLHKLVPQFNRKLIQKRPIIAFLRRWVEYKEAGVLLSLVKWIVGDKDKIYDHPRIEDISVLKDPEKLAAVLEGPEWVKGPGLEMLMLAGGKPQGEPVGMEWLRQFKELSQHPDLKGRLVVVEDTGFPVMRLAAGATTFLYNVPDPTREASGTSQQRWGLNGKPVFAIRGAGMSAQIEHDVSGWILDPFPERSLDELIRDFNPQDAGRIERSRRAFRKRVTVLDSFYFQEAANLYYNEKDELAEMMLNAFRHAYDTVRMERMIHEYEALGISLKNGLGINGFHQIRDRMYRENLLVKVYQWNPELKEKDLTTSQLQGLIKEVWTPLDELELGPQELVSLTGQESDAEAFLLNQGMQRSSEGLWRPTEEVFRSRYLDEIEKMASSRQQEDSAMPTDEKNMIKTYGGINLDSQLLDLQVRRNGEGIPLPLMEQPFQQMRIEGFIPVIINVQPFTMPVKN